MQANTPPSSLVPSLRRGRRWARTGRVPSLKGVVKAKRDSFREPGVASMLTVHARPDKLGTKGKVRSARVRRDPAELMRGPRLQGSIRARTCSARPPGRALNRSPRDRQVPGASAREGGVWAQVSNRAGTGWDRHADRTMTEGRLKGRPGVHRALALRRDHSAAPVTCVRQGQGQGWGAQGPRLRDSCQGKAGPGWVPGRGNDRRRLSLRIFHFTIPSPLGLWDRGVVSEM